MSLRKTYIVNPKFQLSFLLWTVGFVLFMTLVIQVSHVWFFYQLRHQAAAAGLPPNHVFFQFIHDREMGLFWVTVVSSGIIVLLSATWSVFWSHRIAGPLYRLKKHLEETADAEVKKPLQFRKKDYFLEIPVAYNLQFQQRKDKD